MGDRPSKKARTSDVYVDAQRVEAMQSEMQGDKVFPEGISDVSAGKQMVFIELCAGSAVLSAAAQKQGYRIMPVDYKRNRHNPRCKIVSLDLSEDHAWEVLRYICTTCDVVAVHLAPPCGTCSKARGIPMPDGSPGPQPVRSAEHLLGLPALSEMDSLKVTAANRLYERMGNFILWLDEKQIAWVIENPTNSFLWELPYFGYAVDHGLFAHCHACAFGGLRPKKTSFLSNRSDISLMQLFCEDVEPHHHEPWGYSPQSGFATAMEAQYPSGMCDQLVRFLDSICADMGVSVQRADLKLPRVDKQARGRATPQLVPEYEKVSSLLLDQMPPLDSKRCLVRPCRQVPEGSRLLRTEKKGVKLLCVFGIFHSCERFVQLSRCLWHPFDTAAHMPDHLLRCLYEHLTKSPVELVKLRIQRLKLWTSWATLLAAEETRHKCKMNAKVKSVLGPKRLLLMEKVAKSIGWPDTALFSELAEGFRLVGNATKSNVFQPGIKAASMSETQLMKDAKFLKPALLGKIKANKGDAHSGELYRITLEEAGEKGWLDGPLTAGEVDQRFGGQWIPVRRFAVEQRGKLRPIDDLRENRVNEAFSSTERATLYALDHLMWMSIFLARLYRQGGEFKFELEDGSVLVGYVHKDWLEAGVDLKVTAMDLKSAYKQLPLNPLDSDKAVVSLWSEGDRDVRCFACNTLPFGASASVHNFLRVSAFLQAAGCALGILWTSYFDDFPMVSHSLHTSSTLVCAKGLMSLFGFVYSEEKLAPFGYDAEILGVVVDLKDAAAGKITISNKPSRVDELKEALDGIFKAGVIIPNKMPSVLGKLQYADSHVWGRAGRLALADLREVGHTSPLRVELDETQLDAFRVLRDRLCSGRPKAFLADDVTKPALLFTDGALEYDGDKPVATVGAVYLGVDGTVEVFGAHVPDVVLETWKEDGKTHVIGLVELYACVASLLHWKKKLRQRRIIMFVDNWPALDVLVKGTSFQRRWRELLLLLEDPDEDSFLLWVARVPSKSNVADHPSRGSVKELSFLRPFRCVKPKCPVTNVSLNSLIAEADLGEV